ncbi:MAG: SdpI family protein [Sarcina sp.]
MKTNLKKSLLLFFMFLPLIITLISLNYLPDLIPAHYGFNGEVTRWGSKYESLIIPILGAIICTISFICTKSISKNPENKNNIKSLNACNIVLVFTFNALTLSFLISSFNEITNINNSLSSKLIYISFGIGFIILGNYLPKCKRNDLLGIRTSLTLSNDNIWFKTHRFGGKAFVIFGFIFTIASLFIPGNMAMPILISSLLILTVIVSLYPKKLVKKNI